MMVAVRRTHARTHARRAPHKRRARRREGAVMLIVMMILLVATTLAGVSLQATQYELRAAGFARSALQTQYVSEAAMTTTMAWVDGTAPSGQWLEHLQQWNAATNNQGPDLAMFGEPVLGTAGRNTMRTQWTRQSRLMAVTMPPITLPGASNDPTGSFGPRVNARPGMDDPLQPNGTDYAVDMYDCQPLYGAGLAGMQANQGGSGTHNWRPWYCVVTARGRSYVPGGNESKRKWTDPGGNAYTVNRFGLAHDSRGTLVTPPMAMQ